MRLRRRLRCNSNASAHAVRDECLQALELTIELPQALIRRIFLGLHRLWDHALQAPHFIAYPPCVIIASFACIFELLYSPLKVADCIIQSLLARFFRGFDLGGVVGKLFYKCERAIEGFVDGGFVLFELWWCGRCNDGYDVALWDTGLALAASSYSRER